MSEIQENLSKALGRIPSGLFIVTGEHPQGQTAMLASWVMQCGFQPPMISIVLKEGRPMEEAIRESKTFGVNVIHKESAKLIGHFAKGFTPGEPPYVGVSHRTLPSGATSLDGAHAFLECRVKERIQTGDHVLYTAEVLSGELLNEGDPTVHVRKNGLQY